MKTCATLFVPLLFALCSCSVKSRMGCLPTIAVDETISELQLQGKPTPTRIRGGLHGIILYRNGDTYLAYDRQAPHRCVNENCTLEISPGSAVATACDGAKFLLSTGAPLSGTHFPLIRYRVTESNGLIHITN